jgi:hypothetical protein
MVIIILRSLIAMVGAVICFVGLGNAWVAWAGSENTSGAWTTTIVGAVMWLQALPILIATTKEKLRNPERD